VFLGSKCSDSYVRTFAATTAFERFPRLMVVTTSSGFNVPERRSEWPAKKLTAYGKHAMR